MNRLLQRHRRRADDCEVGIGTPQGFRDLQEAIVTLPSIDAPNDPNQRQVVNHDTELPARVVHGGHYPSFGRTRLRELTGEYLRGLRVPGCPADALVPR